jgi:hypothetical protein
MIAALSEMVRAILQDDPAISWHPSMQCVEGMPDLKKNGKMLTVPVSA